MRKTNYIETAKQRAYLSLSQEQVEFIVANLSRMKRADIAKDLGIPVVRLKRAASFAKWSFSFTNGFADKKYPASTVKKVTKFYEKHGKRKSQDKFPGVNIRSIVERYKNFSPRQSRWKEEELVELVKFAGLVRPENQAIFFQRPLANKGSIVSAWIKKFKCKQTFLHGLPLYKAEIFLSPEAPTVKTQFKCGNGDGSMVLFSDAVNYLRDDCPDFVVSAIKAMAEFQTLLFGNNPQLEIESILCGLDFAPLFAPKASRKTKQKQQYKKKDIE